MTPDSSARVVWLAGFLALASGAAAWFVGYRQGLADDTAYPAPGASVLSPRRAPELFRNVVADTRLASRIDAVTRPLAPKACAVVHAGDTTVLSVEPDALLIPASALKLTTAAAFLSKVGGRGRFVTTAVFARPDSGGVVHGDLLLIGGGDPLLATGGYVSSRKYPPRPATDLGRLVQDIVGEGVRRISGGVGVTDARYDAERLVPSWKTTYVSSGDVGPIGALAVDDGFSAYTPRLIAAADPAIGAGEALRAALAAAGVTVDGATHRADERNDALTASVQSVPFNEVVAEMLRESDNNTAELLLKELGRRAAGGAGSRIAGVNARAAALLGLGVEGEAIQAVDGSGLDRSDRASCAALLATLTTKPGGYDIEEMLAVAGQSGTLRERFVTSSLAGKLRAKTGALDGVISLVGVADPAARTKLRFAFVANGSFSDAGGRALQDRLVAALATYPEAPPAAALAP